MSPPPSSGRGRRSGGGGGHEAHETGAPARQWRTRFPLLLVGCILLATPTTASAKSLWFLPPVQTIGDWSFGCDRVGNCTMIGFAAVTEGLVDGPAPRTLSVRFDAAAPLDPVVEALPSDQALVFNQGLQRSTPFRLRLGSETTAIPVSLSRNPFAAEDSRAIISSLQRGRRITGVDHSGSVRMTLPGEGFARAFVAMRMVQDLAMSRDRSEPLVAIRRTGPPLPEGDVPADVRSFSNCSADYDGVRFTRYHFGQASELWRFDCADPPLNALSFWFVSAHGDDRSRSLMLSDRDGDTIDAGNFGIPNASFDFDIGVLRSFVHPDEDVTCGIARVWANTRDGFELIEVREMPVCGHLQVSDWIVTYRRETRQDMTDE